MKNNAWFKGVCVIFLGYFILVTGGVVMAKNKEAPPLLQIRKGIYPDMAPAFPPPPAEPGTEPAPPPPPGVPGAEPVPPPRSSAPVAGPGAQMEVPPEMLANASMAIKTAREARKYFTSWKIWVHRGPAGDVTVKAAIIYQDVAIGCLEFNPVTGMVLPLGYHPRTFDYNVSLDLVKEKLPGVIAGLRVLKGAEFRDREWCWAVPLAYEGKIVAHVKVYRDGVHIVPDYPVDQEMRAYGK